MRVVVLVVLAGCWGGRYTCAQGVTALRLTIERHDTMGATATFDFGPLDENPSVPRGSYRMNGIVRDAEGELLVSLAPDEWIVQPPGYAMVAFDAATEHDGRILRGPIDPSTGCGELEVSRVE